MQYSVEPSRYVIVVGCRAKVLSQAYAFNGKYIDVLDVLFSNVKVADCHNISRLSLHYTYFSWCSPLQCNENVFFLSSEGFKDLEAKVGMHREFPCRALGT